MLVLIINTILGIPTFRDFIRKTFTLLTNPSPYEKCVNSIESILEPIETDSSNQTDQVSHVKGQSSVQFRYRQI